MLVKLLKNMLEPRAAKIETTQDLRTKCLSQDVCGLLLKGSKTVSGQVKTAMNNLLEQHPKVAFASVDTSVLFLSNLEEYLTEFQAGTHRFVVFKKMSGGIEAKEDRLVTSIATLGDKKTGYTSMNELVQSVVDGKAEMTKIPSLPVIKTRTKKLEEEERAKRHRKEQRASQESSSQGTSNFQTNDGSAQGRKAERERRRAEHYKEHNVREKTPEEIQEMERKRRIRMEEEAARWNMAPEDAPEEGEPIQEEYMDTEEDQEYVNEEKKNDDEDEDVLDLD
jgi:hypothetical protein